MDLFAADVRRAAGDRAGGPGHGGAVASAALRAAGHRRHPLQGQAPRHAPPPRRPRAQPPVAALRATGIALAPHRDLVEVSPRRKAYLPWAQGGRYASLATRERGGASYPPCAPPPRPAAGLPARRRPGRPQPRPQQPPPAATRVAAPAAASGHPSRQPQPGLGVAGGPLRVCAVRPCNQVRCFREPT